MRGTSIIIGLKRDEIVQVGWFTGGENFVSKGDQFRDSRTGVMCVFRCAGNGASKRILNVL